MYKKIAALLPAVLLLVSCAKDPSEISRTDVYSNLNYPKNTNELGGVLAAAYGNWRSMELDGFEMLCKDFAASDHTADVAYGGDQPWTDLTVNHPAATNSYVNDLWTGLYRGVKETNVFFDRADYYEKNYGGPDTHLAVEQMRGEAHFLRALYYLELECFYGEAYLNGTTNGDKMGVPIITSVANGIDSTQKARNSVSEVWAFIESELQTAATQLKGVNYDANNKGRVTEWAAKGLLAKAYVYTQNWAAAQPVLEDVIAHSGKSLMPYAKYKDAFVAIAANEFNEESLFEINVDRNSAGGYGIFDQPLTNLTTSQGLIWAVTVIGDNGSENSPISLGYGNEYIHDANLKRFGFPQPLYTMIKNPKYDPSKDSSVNNLPRIIDPAYKATSLANRTNGTVDPRLEVCALQPWIDSASLDGTNWRPIAKCSNIGSITLRDSHYGWSFRKYATFDNNIFNYGPAADGANYYILRLADIYLLYAETMQHQGNTAVALEYINKVHRRAYNKPVNTPDASVDYASLTATTKAIGDPVLGKNPLYYERWAELFNEGHWWFDVCRWRIGKSEAAYYGTSLVGGPIQWDDSRSYTWPIPSNELQRNTVMKQNPGND